MNSSNISTYRQQKRIVGNLSGLSGKLNYSDQKKGNQQQKKETLGNSIQIHSRKHKEFKRLFAIQEKVLKKGIQNTVRYCRRINSFHSKEIVASEGKSNGSIKGVFCCGSSHCPVCSSQVSRNQRSKLKKVIKYSQDKHLSVGMLTLTFSHHLKDNFTEILQKLSEAKTYFMRMRKFRSLDIKWHISRLEFTHSSENGFHPHYHIAFGVEKWDSEKEHMLKVEWMRICEKFGLTCNYKRGADIIIDKDFSQVENYIMKSSKDISLELTSNGTKDSKFESVSIEYLMDIVAGLESDNRYTKDTAKQLLETYFIGIKGKSIFSASNKFQEIYEAIEETEKEKIEKREEDDQVQHEDRPQLVIGRWILHHLSKTNTLHYLYDFIGYNDLTRLYDTLLDVLPEELIGGVIWMDPQKQELAIAA